MADSGFKARLAVELDLTKAKSQVVEYGKNTKLTFTADGTQVTQILQKIQLEANKGNRPTKK